MSNKPGQYEIDWSHPLARDLVICHDKFGIDLFSGFIPVKTGSEIVKNELVHNTTTDKTQLEAGSDEVIGINEVSIVLGYEKTDATFRNSGAFGFPSLASNTRCGCHLPYSNGIVYFDFASPTLTGRVSKAGLTFGDDDWAFIASNSRTTREIWQNGIKQAENTSASAVRVADGGIFALGNNSYFVSDLAIYKYFYVFNRALSTTEIKSLHDDPYQFLKPVRTIQSQVYPALYGEVVGGTTIDIGKTDLTLTSYSPTITATANNIISIGKSDLTLTSYIPIVSAGNNVTIDIAKADLSLNSYIPAITATENNTINIGKTDLTLSSFIPEVIVTAHNTIEINKADLTLSSYAPTIAIGNNNTVDIGKSDLTLTSYAPTIIATANNNISIGKTNLTLNSYASLILNSSNNTIDIAKNNLTLNSYAPTILNDVGVTIDKTDLSLTSYAPVIDVANNQTIDIGKTDLTLNSYSPTITATSNNFIEITKTDLNLNSYIPLITTGEIITVDASRIFTVQSQDRIFNVVAQNRKFNVSPQDKNYTII